VKNPSGSTAEQDHLGNKAQAEEQSHRSQCPAQAGVGFALFL